MTCSMVRTTVSVQVMDLLLVSMVEIEGEANLEVMMMNPSRITQHCAVLVSLFKLF